MKKNGIYFLIVIILAILVYFFVIKKDTSSYSKKESEFFVKDTLAIQTIKLSDMAGHVITLKRDGKYWKLNDKYPARPESVQYILQTIYQLQVINPVAKSMYNSVVKSIAGNNTKVELFNSDNKEIKAFYIGEPSQNYRGNFMLMEGSQVPFIVNIPGFDGFVSSRFFTNEVEWRDRSIFKYNPDDIQKIAVAYPTTPDSSFTITQQNNVFKIELGNTNMQGFNSEIAHYYFSQFKSLNCEAFILDAAKKDSLLTSKPVCEITITSEDVGTKTLKVYYRPVTYRTKMQFTYQGEMLNFDTDKFYGVFNDDKDIAIIQSFVFGKLFVTPPYFFRQRPVTQNALTDHIIK